MPTIEERLAALESKLEKITVVHDSGARRGLRLDEGINMFTDYWLKPSQPDVGGDPKNMRPFVLDARLVKTLASLWLTIQAGDNINGEMRVLHVTTEDAHRHPGIPNAGQGRNIAIDAIARASDHGNTAVRAETTYSGGSDPSYVVDAVGKGMLPGDAVLRIKQMTPSIVGGSTFTYDRAGWGGGDVELDAPVDALGFRITSRKRVNGEYAEFAHAYQDGQGRWSTSGGVVIFDKDRIDDRDGFELRSEGGQLKARRLQNWGAIVGPWTVLA